jgi:hypothetical protein
MGANSGPFTEREHVFYERRQDIATFLRVHPIGGGMDLFDYSPAASGMTYRHEFAPGGVTVDGVPDSPTAGPITWETIDGPQGGLSMSHEVSTDIAGWTTSSYYFDKQNPGGGVERQCTGDNTAYGISGPWINHGVPNTDPTLGPANQVRTTRHIYYEAPGQADGPGRRAQATTPLQVTTGGLTVGYARPKGATPVRVSLVPAYQGCAAGSSNRTHGPPLAYASCTPPAQTSGQLTVGTPDANAAAANSVGSVQYTVIAGAPGGVDDSDVALAVSLTDVRTQGSLTDYTGEVQAASAVRITDRANGPSAAETGTGDYDFPVTVPCAATASTTIGATCALTTTLDAVVPGAVPEGKRSIWALGRVQVNDGGADGQAATAPNGLFATQGVFVP